MAVSNNRRACVAVAVDGFDAGEVPGEQRLEEPEPVFSGGDERLSHDGQCSFRIGLGKGAAIRVERVADRQRMAGRAGRRQRLVGDRPGLGSETDFR